MGRRALTVALLTWLAVAASAQSLRELADRRHLLIGAAVNPVYLTESAYTTTLAREFNMVEAEDAMKWTALRPDVDTFDFSAADRIVAFAEAHAMKVRGHTLAWSKHNPEWLEKGRYTPQQVESLLHAHIRRTVGHFRGRVFAWDVVKKPSTNAETSAPPSGIPVPATSNKPSAGRMKPMQRRYSSTMRPKPKD